VAVDGGIGFLRYRIDADSILLLHVEVPPEARGHGVAAELSLAALEFAKERKLTAIPVCSYVAAYMGRHSDSGR
jgi:predicted GNAT family acetyltransferase